MKLIVQIPAFNEEKTIGQTLRDLPKRIDGVTAIETLVIDDGSTDATVDAARKAGATHILQLKPHRGLAAAFVAGIDAALRLGADIIVNTDADNQYHGSDIARLVAPIVKGTAEVVIGDRDVATSPHMSPFKRLLQRLGSWTVGLASGLRIGDVTSGFRAFSRDAAMQINVFNPFTYTLETIIQSGNRNLGVQSVVVRTNPPTRPSRLYRGAGSYLRKSAATIFRVYTLYKPLKTFTAIGSLLMLAGVAIGARFLWFLFQGQRGGHLQSLILGAVFLIVGFQTLLIALIADLISVNRRLSEEVLIRIKRLEMPASERKLRRDHIERPVRADRPPFPPRRERSGAPTPPRPTVPLRAPAATPARSGPPASAPAPETAQTQWVWLLDEDKLQDRGKAAAPPSPPPAATTDRDDLRFDPQNEADAPDIDADKPDQQRPAGTSRRRRRRRGGMRHATELPGNRGKHLVGTEENGET
ncbi:MAG TPA: glycosyltransferase family 2 protein [Thermoanaerobaculia bacterium]|nr:glycosyltransferase family 2 protein [Thermoanaerobaculia bacterium]